MPKQGGKKRRIVVASMSGYRVVDLGKEAGGWTVVSTPNNWYVAGFESQQAAGDWLLQWMIANVRFGAEHASREQARRRKEYRQWQAAASVLLSAPDGKVH